MAGSLDFTGAQMVLTLKLIATAVSYQDHNSKAAKVRVRVFGGCLFV